jgi:ABC-type sugar transport system permease subunit/ABC-type glycerol-3-phosphate transport system substrate-binding protein
MLRTLLPRLAVALLAVPFVGLGAVALVATTVSPRIGADQTRLFVWGLPSGEETKGLDAQLREFERRNPRLRVVNLGAGSMALHSQKLMTSIAGNVPPDLVRQDRFTIGDWASRETFQPLDELLARERRDDPSGIFREDYYRACWAEAVYHGRVYAIPDTTDDRLLYWNKALFRQAGMDAERPPRTWEELLEFTLRLTRRNPDNTFATIGFIPVVPTFSNSWFYLYSWQNEGTFMSPDGRTCTLDNPNSREALEWLARFYDRLEGAEKITAFASTFQPQELDPFLTGKMAIKIDTNNAIRNIARFGPKLDFGVAPAPVPAARLRGEGRFAGQPPFITWSGGFSLAIPRGSPHPREAWQLLKWLNSLEGRRVFNRAQQDWNVRNGRPYVPEMLANFKISETIFREFAPQGSDPLSVRLRAGMRVGLEMMPYARFRPVTFVGQRLWDEHIRAFDLATRHKSGVPEALGSGQRIVQTELDKVFYRDRFPVLDWGYPVGALAAAVAAALAVLAAGALRRRNSGRLMRGEAAAGYLFASPWMIGFLVFTAGPIVTSLIVSFCDYDVLHPARFVGLENFRSLLRVSDLRLHWMEGVGAIRRGWQGLEVTRYLGVTATMSDAIAWRSLYNGAYLSLLGIPLNMLVSLSLAMLLNARVRGMHFYRTVYYLPAITPVVATAILWPWILNPDSGVLNQAWRATLTHWFSLPAPGWLASEEWSKPAYIVVGAWSAGNAMILWLAGLQGVPQHLYEAAEMDGATAWHRFRHVTLPMITPYILFNLIMGTIASLQRFTDVYLMSSPTGGPVDSTMVPVLYLFNNAFQYFKMGYASAWAWILFVVILGLTLFQLRSAKRWVHYEGERGK